MTFDNTRPAVLLTREEVAAFCERLTVAAITTTVRGLSSEVHVGAANGLEADSVINCYDIYTVATTQIGQRIGWLLDHHEDKGLAEAVIAAFALEA